LFDDIKYYVENSTYPIREISARLHHRLVYIHPYPNGNGRFSRLFADILLVNSKLPRFTWERDNLSQAGETRKRYLDALKAADKNDYSKLFAFLDIE
jgi:Fic family protein